MAGDKWMGDSLGLIKGSESEGESLLSKSRTAFQETWGRIAS